jgi:hypothetical protein
MATATGRELAGEGKRSLIMSRWNDVPGVFRVQLSFAIEDGVPRVFDADRERELPPELLGIISTAIAVSGGTLDEFTLAIHFLSSGTYTPARWGQRVDDSEAPHHEDERTLDYADVDGVQLPQDLAQKLFDLYAEEIDSATVEYETAE